MPAPPVQCVYECENRNNIDYIDEDLHRQREPNSLAPQ